jgi:5-methylcytosine-specific restriction endonuclease McrA
MSKQVKAWARRAKAELLAKLGAQCAWCGLADVEHLEFDCIVPTGDDHHRKSQDVRMSFYRYQHQEHDNIQVLCHRCNAKKGDAIIDFRRPELNWEQTGEFAPF